MVSAVFHAPLRAAMPPSSPDAGQRAAKRRQHATPSTPEPATPEAGHGARRPASTGAAALLAACCRR